MNSLSNFRAMKKIFKFLAAMAAATMAFSCMEEANPEVNTGETSYDGPMVTLSFSVDKLTKTSYDKENGHQWSEGDKIKIVFGEESNAYTVAEVVNGTVTAKVGEADVYYAVYPETAEHRFDKPADSEETKFSVRIPRNQDGTFKTANLMYATTTVDQLSLNFKNLTHILKFELKKDHGFDVIEFCANTETIITGRYFVNIFNNDETDEEDVEMTYNSTGSTNSKYITVNKLSEKDGTFYVGLLPGADMSTGIVLRGKKTGEDYKYFALSKTALETNRSEITPIGSIDGYLRENVWYITENGTGDGSKDNPAGISKLIEIMSKITLNDDTKTKTMHQWRLCDAEVYLAAGTYNIPKANNNATFEPNGLTEYANMTIKGVEGTVLTTVAAQNVRIFRFNNAGKIGTVTFENITFQGTGETGAISVGVGTYCSGNTAGTINYNNCTFTGFNNSGTNDGAVILCAGDGERVLNFSGCTFENNLCNSASGAIGNTGSKSTINFSKCTFQNNAAKYGAVLYTSNGVVNCTGCEFKSNTAINGGAAYINGGTVSFGEGCEFKSNVATTELENTDAFGGAICVKKGDVTIDGATFTENNAQNYGGAVHASGVEISILNSSFVGNTCACGGALSNEIGVMTVDGCSFKENGSVSKSGMGGAIVTYDEYPKAVYPIGATSQKSGNATVETGKIATLYVYNSEFDGNYYYKDITTDTDKSGTAGQGAAIQVHGLGKMALVNCTFANHIGSYGGIIRCRPSAAPGSTVYMISCTGNTAKTFHNQDSTAYIYNCITNGYGSGGTHVTNYYNSIKSTELWKADGKKADEAVVFAEQIGDFANGVFPAKGAAATNGMSSTDLAALGAADSDLMTAMPLFDDKKLTVDQKGNPREGKIMGAYVGM